MRSRYQTIVSAIVTLAALLGLPGRVAAQSFVNFESGHVRPLACRRTATGCSRSIRPQRLAITA
jgi:hypothetical protein